MINYYILDSIKEDEHGCYLGYLGNDFVEVFPLSSEDDEETLIVGGYAKCDAPGSETFIIEETSYSCVLQRQSLVEDEFDLELMELQNASFNDILDDYGIFSIQ